MPRHLSVLSAIDKSNLDSGTAYVAILHIQVISPTTKQVVDDLYVCANNEDIVYQGNTYVATVLELSFSEEAGEIGGATVGINDFNRYIRQQEEAIGGSIGSTVNLKIINTSDLTQPPEFDADYQVTGSTAKDWKITWQLGSENALSLPFPKGRQYKDRCRFKYKDANTCGYTGSMPSCSLSLDGPNGCAAHNNTINFGGFPGISRTK